MQSVTVRTTWRWTEIFLRTGGAVGERRLEQFELAEEVLAGGWAEACILCDLALLLAHGAHHKGRHEHDAPSRDDLEAEAAHLELLVVEVGQSQAPPAGELPRAGPRA